MPNDAYSRALHELRDAVTVHIAVYEQCQHMPSFLLDMNSTAGAVDAAIRGYEKAKMGRT